MKAISSLIDSYISLSSLTKAILQRVSKWGSLSFPMTQAEMPAGPHLSRHSCPHTSLARTSTRGLYYTILYYTILYYNILYYTIIYYTILYYTILY